LGGALGHNWDHDGASCQDLVGYLDGDFHAGYVVDADDVGAA
jgi:hypothetical protein